MTREEAISLIETDDEGRKLHICLRDPKTVKHGRCKFFLPTIALGNREIVDYRAKCKETRYWRNNIIQWRLGVAWWRWQFSLAIAEWRDDRTNDEIFHQWDESEANTE